MPSVDGFESEKRITQVLELLAQGYTTTEIANTLMQKYCITKRNAWGWIKKARERCQKEAEARRDEIRAESLQFYRTLIKKTMALPDYPTALRARKRIDELFGCDAPKELVVDDRREVKELLERIGQDKLDQARQALSDDDTDE